MSGADVTGAGAGGAGAGGPVVVGFGEVPPAMVTPYLPPDVRLVADPGEEDLRVAVAAVVRADAVVDRALLARMPALKVLARTGVGVERVDVAEATRRGVPVVVTPGAGTNAVAEGVFAMTLHLVKRLRETTECVAGGGWAARGRIPVGDLEGATLGIVGYGRIGRRVAVLGHAFGMTVLAHDPYLAPGVAGPIDPTQLVDLAQLGRRSDVLTLHLPLTPATKHCVDEAFLAGLPRGAVVINCGRGPLLDLDAAHRALDSGHLGGLGLDVYDPEPPEHHPVFDRPDVVLSPHLMGMSAGATRATFAAAARGVADVLAGRRPQAVADPGWEKAAATSQ